MATVRRGTFRRRARDCVTACRQQHRTVIPQQPAHDKEHSSMSTLNEHQRLIKRLTRDHNATIKRLEAARDVCSIGTNSYRQYEESIASERRKHVQSLVDFGVIPQNLENAQKTEFHYISHVHVLPASRAEAEAIMQSQIKKEVAELNYTEADEAIRAEFESNYPTK
jgi:hypothetical protein